MVRGTVASATTSAEAVHTWDFVLVATMELRDANLKLVTSPWKLLDEESWVSSLERVEVVRSRALSTRARREPELCD